MINRELNVRLPIENGSLLDIRVVADDIVVEPCIGFRSDSTPDRNAAATYEMDYFDPVTFVEFGRRPL
jgi:hypothetical protein